MTFRVNGTEVGVYSTSQSFPDWYDYDTNFNPNAHGVDQAGVFFQGGTRSAYVFAVESGGEYALGICGWWDSGSEDAQMKTIVKGIATTPTGLVFEEGQGIDTGAHGQHDFVYDRGDPVADTGDSSKVFEEGTGIGFFNTQTLVEDDPESFGGTVNDDGYIQDGDDLVAQHLWSFAQNGDGVMWPLPAGSYSFDIEMQETDDNRDNTGFLLPDEWAASGPSGQASVGSAGAGSTVTVEVDV